MNRKRLAELLARKRATFADRHPGSARAHQQAGSLFGRVPMTWMNIGGPGRVPVHLPAPRNGTEAELLGA